MEKIIDHTGTIINISGDIVKVKIEAQPACHNCVAKKICSNSESKDILIDVIASNSKEFGVNETVKVLLKLSSGYKALLLGYVFPLFLVLLFLIISIVVMGLKELYAGLLSLAVLFPYYIIVYYFRNQMKKKFTFELMKLP